MLPTQVPWNLKTACEVDTFSIFHFNQLRKSRHTGDKCGKPQTQEKEEGLRSQREMVWSRFPGVCNHSQTFIHFPKTPFRGAWEMA